MNQYMVSFCSEYYTVEYDALIAILNKINEHGGHVDAVIPTIRRVDCEVIPASQRTDINVKISYTLIYSAAEEIPMDEFTNMHISSTVFLYPESHFASNTKIG